MRSMEAAAQRDHRRSKLRAFAGSWVIGQRLILSDGQRSKTELRARRAAPKNVAGAAFSGGPISRIHEVCGPEPPAFATGRR